MGFFSRRKKNETSTPVSDTPVVVSKPRERFLYEPRYARRDALSCMPAGDTQENIDAIKNATAMRLSRSVSDFSTMSSNPKLARNSHSFSTLDYRSYANSVNGSRPGSLYGMSALGRSTMNAPPVPGIPLAYSTNTTPGPSTPSNLTRESSMSNMLTIMDNGSQRDSMSNASRRSPDLQPATFSKSFVTPTYPLTLNQNDARIVDFPHDSAHPSPARIWSGSDSSETNEDNIEIVPRLARNARSVQARRVDSSAIATPPRTEMANPRVLGAGTMTLTPNDGGISPEAPRLPAVNTQIDSLAARTLDASRSYPNDPRLPVEEARAALEAHAAFADANAYPEEPSSELATPMAATSFSDDSVSVAKASGPQDSRSPIQEQAAGPGHAVALHAPNGETVVDGQSPSLKEGPHGYGSLPGSFPPSPYSQSPVHDSRMDSVHAGPGMSSSEGQGPAYSYHPLQSQYPSHPSGSLDQVSGYHQDPRTYGYMGSHLHGPHDTQSQQAWTPIGPSTFGHADPRDPRTVVTTTYKLASPTVDEQSIAHPGSEAAQSMTPGPLQITSASTTARDAETPTQVAARAAVTEDATTPVPGSTNVPSTPAKKSRLGFLRRSSAAPAAQGVVV